MTEINKEFYCSAGVYMPKVGGMCLIKSQATDKLTPCEFENCSAYHCKYPNPEQFEQEHGFKWEGAVYVWWEQEKCWMALNDPKTHESFIQVCACTPWGRPPADWRPE